MLSRKKSKEKEVKKTKKTKTYNKKSVLTAEDLKTIKGGDVAKDAFSAFYHS